MKKLGKINDEFQVEIGELWLIKPPQFVQHHFQVIFEGAT